MRKLSKVTVALGATAVVLGSAGAAYAYWTTTGSGSGSSTTSAGAGTVTLHASFPAAALAPGAPQNVAYTADNANSYSTKVGALTVTSVTVDATHVTAGCQAADFSATAVTSNTTVAPTSSGTSVGSGVITLTDTAADQSACKGATITINVTSV
ncbi:MAG: hypothetical protein JWP14_3359 [Frankiales bacterium]|nr:hypothetical protein [Frankiales bacterium]